MKVQDHCQMQPSFLRQNVADIARPFLGEPDRTEGKANKFGTILNLWLLSVVVLILRVLQTVILLPSEGRQTRRCPTSTPIYFGLSFLHGRSSHLEPAASAL